MQTECLLNAESKDQVAQIFPNVSVVIQNHVLTLTPYDYLDECYLLPQKVNGYQTVCMTNFELSWIDSYLLLGDVFLQTFFVHFDIENRRVGMTRSLNTNNFTFALDPHN